MLPKYGGWSTIYRRFRRWSEAGVWEAVAVTLTEIIADSGHYGIDNRQYPSQRPRPGSGRKRGLIDALLAGSRSGFTSKLHCLVDALGRPLACNLTVGEAADCKAYVVLIGLTERAPVALLAKKGYDATATRTDQMANSFLGMVHLATARYWIKSVHAA